MGIPRYFGSVVRELGVVSDGVPARAAAASHLCVDFNGVIYPALRRAEGEARAAGEALANERVYAEVWRDLEAFHSRVPAARVFVAHDGVCPYAKVVQQRKRRLLRHLDPYEPPAPGAFDTAHVSPGTAFTEGLVRFMHARCAERGWYYSGADEPGEGEHKMFQWLTRRRRVGDAIDSVVIHGLDADILVLSMLWTSRRAGAGAPTFVVREDGDATTCVDVAALRREIHTRVSPDAPEEWCVRSYCFLMSVCGNDFLPRVPGMEVSPDTCDEIASALATLVARSRATPDLATDAGALFELVSDLADAEDARVAAANARYLGLATARARRGEAAPPVSPLAYAIRRARAGWRPEYHAWMCGTPDPGTVAEVARAYLTGMTFVWEYYDRNGDGLDWRWHYPWPHAPSFRDLANLLSGGAPETRRAPAPPISARQQLLAITPAASADAVVPPVLRDAYARVSAYHPRSCRVCTWGVRRFHEVVPVLPIIPVGLLESATAPRRPETKK